jgi:hypothetical protein
VRPTTAAPVPRRRALVEAAVVAGLVALLYFVLRPDAVRTFGAMYDDVVYVSLGKAISLGHGYRSDHIVGAPVHEKFPPGLPALYALLWLVAGSLEGTLRLALLSSIAASAGAAALIWYYSRRALGNGVLSTALLAIQPLLFLRSLRYFSGAASEPWFVLAWAGALVLAWRVMTSPAERVMRAAVGLGLVLAGAAFVRTQGVVLIPAILLAMLVGRAPRRAVGAALTGALLPLLGWRLWHARMLAAGPVAAQPDQVGYSTWIPHESVGAFAAFARRVLAVNVPGYVATASDIVVGWQSSKAQLLLAAVAILTLVGAARALRRRPELWTTLGANAGVILLWPYLQDRFLVALMPFIGLAAAYGLEGVLAHRRVRRPALARVVVFTAIIAATVYLGRPLGAAVARGATGKSAVDDVVFARIFQQRSSEVASWVEANTPSDARVMTELGGGIYLRTGRRTVIGIPEEPFTGPSVLEPPGRYVAGQLVADSVTHIVAWAHMGPVLKAQVEGVQRACPGVIERVAPFLPDSARLPPRYYVVRRGADPCVGAFMKRTAPAPE